MEAKINLFQREIDDLEQEKVKLLGEMITDFEMVGDAKLYDVLKEYYVDGRTWKEISQSTGYAERYVMQLRNKALERIAKVLNKSE